MLNAVQLLLLSIRILLSGSAKSQQLLLEATALLSDLLRVLQRSRAQFSKAGVKRSLGRLGLPIQIPKGFTTAWGDFQGHTFTNLQLEH